MRISGTIRRGYPFVFQVDGASAFTLVGDGFAPKSFNAPLSLSPEDTKALPAGAVRWEAEDADGAFLTAGRFVVALSAKADGEQALEKSFAEQALAKVEEALLTMSASGEISIGGDEVNFSYETRSELLAYRERLKDQVKRERYGNPVGARFKL